MQISQWISGPFVTHLRRVLVHGVGAGTRTVKLNCAKIGLHFFRVKVCPKCIAGTCINDHCILGHRASWPPRCIRGSGNISGSGNFAHQILKLESKRLIFAPYKGCQGIRFKSISYSPSEIKIFLVVGNISDRKLWKNLSLTTSWFFSVVSQRHSRRVSNTQKFLCSDRKGFRMRLQAARQLPSCQSLCSLQPKEHQSSWSNREKCRRKRVEKKCQNLKLESWWIIPCFGILMQQSNLGSCFEKWVFGQFDQCLTIASLGFDINLQENKGSVKQA